MAEDGEASAGPELQRFPNAKISFQRLLPHVVVVVVVIGVAIVLVVVVVNAAIIIVRVRIVPGGTNMHFLISIFLTSIYQ